MFESDGYCANSFSALQLQTFSHGLGAFNMRGYPARVQ